jgi:Fe-S cluster assembly protein SufB
MEKALDGIGEYKYGFSDPDTAVYRSKRGFTREIVEEISHQKNEPDWMRKLRLKAYEHAIKRPMPTWGGDISGLDLENMYYYVRPSEKTQGNWEDVPDAIRIPSTAGIPEAERKFLAGVGAVESEMVYHSIRENLEKQGVIFLSSDDGLKQYPDIYKEYFGTVIPYTDNKFAAINTAVWSGGSFVYVPKGVHVEMPLQAYFRLNSENMGQFERTLIIVDEGAQVHYVEGCTAPTYSSDSFHSGVIEIMVRKGARCRYTTIQNWSTNVYNLVTHGRWWKKRHHGMDRCQPGQQVDDEVSVHLPHGKVRAAGSVNGVRGRGQHQHGRQGGACGAAHPCKIQIHLHDGGRACRGLLKVYKGAEGASSHVQCDALLLDEASRTDTYPYIEIDEDRVTIGHEATVSKIGDEQLFYLQSRGLNEVDARAMVVSGFIEPLVKELPMEYAVEMNRLIHLQMEGTVG